jgi:hypothetical protein
VASVDSGLSSPTGIAAPALEFMHDLTAGLDPAFQIGDCGRGSRLIVPARGGTVSGPRLREKLLSPSGDWLSVRTDGTGELDVRGIIGTDDGALIYVTYRGYLTDVPSLMPRWAAGETIPPDEYYFRTTPYYETGAPQYAWLTKIVAVGVGSLVPGGVSYRIFEVK